MAAVIVRHNTPFEVRHHDTGSADGLVDYRLYEAGKHRGDLEVMLAVPPKDIWVWNCLAEDDGRVWSAESSWYFSPSVRALRYKATKAAAQRAVQICDEHGVDEVAELDPPVREQEQCLWPFLEHSQFYVGSLTRYPSLTAGISVGYSIQASFPEAEESCFSLVLEGWSEAPETVAHVKKVTRAEPGIEGHLFLIAPNGKVPIRYFEDDFSLPHCELPGFKGVDVLWVWSQFWKRALRIQGRGWEWVPLQLAPGSSSDAES